MRESMGQRLNLSINQHDPHELSNTKKTKFILKPSAKRFSKTRFPDSICMKGFQDLHTEAPADHSRFDPFLLRGSLLVLNATGGEPARKDTVSRRKKNWAGPQGQIRCFLISCFALSLKASLLSLRARQLWDLTIAEECLACKMTHSVMLALSPQTWPPILHQNKPHVDHQ